jgi:NADP-reducing hydrogenase subunit HndC
MSSKENLASFDYELFDTKAIFVCSSERCAKHSTEIYNYFEQLLKDNELHEEIRLEWSRCMRLCDLGPNVMVFPEGEAYSRMTKEKAQQIVCELSKSS